MSTAQDGAAAQLHDALKESITDARSDRRPILTHLNADTTWLLSIPYPAHTERPLGRSRYNVLIDPWLKGPQSDVAGWFSTQWHAIKSSVQSVAELDAMLGHAERLELATASSGTNSGRQHVARTYVDLVVVSHEFTDHCHKLTLMEVDPDVPVFSTPKAVELIQSWSHFTKVVNMGLFGEGVDWRTTSTSPLPPWLGVSRLVTANDALYYHSAIILCVRQSRTDSAEAVIYTPHGVQASTLSTLKTANPPVHTLAFLHGLHDVSITLTKQLNLGAHNALKAQRLLQSRYWVGTHDEVKIGGGLLAPFLRRKAHTLLDALAKESKPTSKAETEAETTGRPDVFYEDLGSGESLLLR